MSPNLSRRSLWLNKIADEVARGLRHRIETGALPVGAEIPDREEIAADFVTTLGTVDRALDMMVEEGLLTEQEGGVYTVNRGTDGESVFEVPEDFGSTKEDIIAVLELRLGVEVGAVALAAERRDEADLRVLREALAGYEAAAEAREGVAQADFRFHCAIARAARSRYILDLLEYLGPLLIPRMRVAIGPPDAAQADQNLTASIGEHRAIVEAIAAGDEAAARDAMRAHIRRSIGLIRGLEAKT